MDKENLIGSIVFVVALASYIAFNYWRTEAHVSGRVSIDGAAYAAETCTGFQSGVTILLAGNMRLRATRTSAHQSLLEYNGVRQDCSQLHLRVQPGQIVSRIYRHARTSRPIMSGTLDFICESRGRVLRGHFTFEQCRAD